ncbi:MAG TPA: histidine kinase dimerization/phospho-acceptor domain-containing protein, partial [Bacteroidales bacterium]|nr:histidine kinase dimerization/phospho-acceptor domain-containing protein [Bacteroidales bacterium]
MKTSIKILSVVFMLLILSGVSFFFLFYTQQSQQKNLVKLTTNQYSQAFESLLENASTRYLQQVSDYTYWDEMCRFMKTRDIAWSDENLATVVRGYDLDNVIVISPDNQTVIYTYPMEERLIPDLIRDAKGMLRDLYRKRLLETYIYDKESGRVGVLYAATIHPTNDVQRLTNPQGFFFMCKYWDTKFLNEIERISGSNIKVVTNCNTIAPNVDTVTFYKPIKGISGKILAYLKIERPAPYLKLNHDFSKNVLLIFIVSAIVLILIVSVSLLYLIGKPLNLLGHVLKGNKNLLPQLKKIGGEYVQIGEIIEQTNIIQEELEKAKIRAEESDRLKSAFLANISHEIRTPMNAIMGFSQILPDQFDNKAQLKECTDIISQRCQDLLDIVNSMIDLSKINTGNVMIQSKTCDLTVLFAELKDQFEKIRVRSGKDTVAFNIRFETEKQQFLIVTDFGKIKEIFVHLLSNAFKFTKVGKVEAGCFEDEQRGLVFFVTDTGKGIPKDKQTKIFNYFTRLDNGLTDIQSGTGLG